MGRSVAVASSGVGPEVAETAVEFVRFCRGRRRVAWPEIYDEMCAVARRRLFRGWGFDELADDLEVQLGAAAQAATCGPHSAAPPDAHPVSAADLAEAPSSAEPVGDGGVGAPSAPSPPTPPSPPSGSV